MIDLDSVTVVELEADPYPIYAELRESAPAVYMPSLDVWMIVRWEGATEAATNPAMFPAHVDRSPTDRALGGVSMMTVDGEPAKSRRRPFDPTFRPRAVEASMPAVFDRICDERLDRMAQQNRAELVGDYFEPVSLLALATALGIDDLVDLSTLRRWFAGLAAGVSNYEDDASKTAFCDEVAAEIDETLESRFESAMAGESDGLFAELIEASSGTLEQRIEWAMPSVKLVLLGGLQEPAHGGATIAACLLSHPDQLRDVRASPDLVAPAVEEGLRWTAPIGNLLRGIESGASVEGMDLPAGERAIIVVASANRDREIWGDRADDFDIHRSKRVHMSFATGPHYCIGHHFARVQLRVATRKLFDRFPDMRLEADVVYRGHEYRSPIEVKVALG